MKYFLRTKNCSLPAAVAIVSVVLAGCDKLTPNGQSETMSLLKGGSERVCVAPDVQKALRDLILPLSDPSAAGDDAKRTRDAITAVTISFDLTTLQSADKGVNRAECNTVAKMTGFAGDQRSFTITYQISPSAEKPGNFVVSGNTADAHAFANVNIASLISQKIETDARTQQAADAVQAKQKVLAIVTPRWLLGTWLPAGLEGADCGNGRAFTFAPGHRLVAYQLTGVWALTGDQLHLAGQGEGGGLNATSTITAADATSFTLLTAKGISELFRRCTKDETNTIPTMNSTEGMEALPDQ